MKKNIFIAACALLVGWTGLAYAVPIFYDNFDSENDGKGTSNYSSFSKWYTDGYVDLKGGGYWDGTSNLDLSYKDGLSVDLDGSKEEAGTMKSKDIKVVSGQTYYFSFLLAGNLRDQGDESLTVSVKNSSYSERFTVASTKTWMTISRSVTISGDNDIANIIFNHAGGDNYGALIDNVSFSAAPVPEPTTMLLFGTGIAGLAAIRRRRK